MPPKRKVPAKKKEDSPPPSETEVESESDYSEEEPESPKPKKTKGAAAKPKAPPKAKVAPTPPPKVTKAPAKPKKEATKKAPKAPAPKAPAPKAPAPEVVVVVEKPAPPPPTPVEKKTVPKAASKQVIIEHCKQCQSFKRTATKLEELLKKAIPDLDVALNPGPEKPRKGIFEVRDSEGTVFISLQGLVRPFKKMKDLNLEETADDVVSKLTVVTEG